MSLNELIAIPSQDDWRYEHYYHGKPIFSQASFVAGALEALGVFHGVEINASEFTVKDIYQLDIYDKEFERPDNCIEADYSLPYCQLFGKFRLELPGMSRIHPYEHMNESCTNVFENKMRAHAC